MKRTRAKPRFIRDIEEHTGLECREGQRLTATRIEWDILSPTGIVLFRVGSIDGDTIGSLGHPSMYDLR